MSSPVPFKRLVFTLLLALVFTFRTLREVQRRVRPVRFDFEEQDGEKTGKRLKSNPAILYRNNATMSPRTNHDDDDDDDDDDSTGRFRRERADFRPCVNYNRKCFCLEDAQTAQEEEEEEEEEEKKKENDDEDDADDGRNAIENEKETTTRVRVRLLVD